jgi:hypothetical protein
MCLHSEEQRVSGPKGTSQNVRNKKIQRVLFIDKIKYAAKSNVCSIASLRAFDRLTRVRPQMHHSAV